MTEAEYVKITSRMRSLWPSLHEWWQSLKQANPEALGSGADFLAGIRERWRLALLTVSLSDAEEAVKALAANPEDPWPFPSDKERAAAVVAAKAREIARDRAKAERERKERATLAEMRPQVPKGKDDFPAGQLLAVILRKINAAPIEEHSPECGAGRKERGRCLCGCPVVKRVASDVLARWDTAAALGKVFEPGEVT